MCITDNGKSKLLSHDEVNRILDDALDLTVFDKIKRILARWWSGSHVSLQN